MITPCTRILFPLSHMVYSIGLIRVIYIFVTFRNLLHLLFNSVIDSLVLVRWVGFLHEGLFFSILHYQHRSQLSHFPQMMHIHTRSILPFASLLTVCIYRRNCQLFKTGVHYFSCSLFCQISFKLCYFMVIFIICFFISDLLKTIYMPSLIRVRYE